MYEYTERLKLPLLIPNQSGKEITHNEALIIIDNLLQNHVMSKSLNTPPDSSNSGDIYIVSNNATGDWFGKENQLAIFDNGWRFLEPINGMLFYILYENCFYVYKDNWIKLEYLIDFTKLQNIAIDNLQKDELIKYDGNDFVNTREINLLKLYINNKLLIDEDFNISNDIKISGVNIDEHIVNVVNNNAEGFAKADLSNLTEEGQNSIKNVVNENVLNKDIDNITQTGINNIQNYLMPDYSAGIEFSWDTSDQVTINNLSYNGKFVAPSNGVVFIRLDLNNGTEVIVINDNVVLKSIATAYSWNSFIFFYLSKGDILRVNNFERYTEKRFFPLKGGQNA